MNDERPVIDRAGYESLMATMLPAMKAYLESHPGVEANFTVLNVLGNLAGAALNDAPPQVREWFDGIVDDASDDANRILRRAN